MAAKSRSTQTDYDKQYNDLAHIPRTPRAKGELQESLARLCERGNIDLGLEVEKSPLKRSEPSDRIRKLYADLFFHDRGEQSPLRQIERDFIKASSKLSPNKRVEDLLQRLQGPAAAVRKGLTSRATLEAKLAAARPSEVRQNKPVTAPRTDLKSTFKATKPRAESLKSSCYNDGNTVTATTSFNTDGGASTSFGSNPPPSNDTAATSFDTDPQPLGGDAQDSDFGSSFGTSVAGKLMALDRENQIMPSNVQSNSFRTKRSTINTVGTDRSESRPPSSLSTEAVTAWTALPKCAPSDAKSDLQSTLIDSTPTSEWSPTQISELDKVASDHLRGQGTARRTKTYKRVQIGDRFAQLHLPDDKAFTSLSFKLQFEVQRVLQNCGDHMFDYLREHWQSPRTLDSLYSTVAKVGSNSSWQSFQSSEEDDSSGRTFKAALRWAASNTGPLFDMVLGKVVGEDACNMQRYFGAANVLFINMPSLGHPQDQHRCRQATERFRKTFRKPQIFLGQKWILIDLIPIKKNDKKKYKIKDEKIDQKKDASDDLASRLILIAMGDRSVADIFAYFFDYQSVCGQPAPKLFSRIDLHASRAKAVIPLNAQDISYNVDDQHATNEQDDRQACHEPFDHSTVMNDGCNVISAWLAFELGLKVDSLSRCVFQCRIAGAKGVWFCATPTSSAHEESKPAGPHITISKSQVKAFWSSFADCPSEYLTLNLVNPNSNARPSILHTSYLPILLDRHVPRCNIFAVVRTQVSARMATVVDAVNGDPVAARQWLHAQKQFFEERNRERGIDNIAGFPVNLEERIIKMLEAGFIPSENRYLADVLLQEVDRYLKYRTKNFTIPLMQSTTLMGIADPHQCLKPDEVHVAFSSPFKDPYTGAKMLTLHGRELLVARNPAMAPWDIRKVVCACKPELMHLTDAVVFASRGKRPLASQLQGGDYDGDTFWICWEPLLTGPFQNASTPFQNASTPYKLPPPQNFGIRKCEATLRDYVRDARCDEQWLNWTVAMAQRRLTPSLLGRVTLMHERLTYKQKGISSREAVLLVHLHDYLVDADKQGYDFNENELKGFLKAEKIDTKLPDPAYWRYKSARDNTTGAMAIDNTKVVGNIIDEVFEGVVEPLIDTCRKKVRTALETAQWYDEDLGLFYAQFIQQNFPNDTNVDLPLGQAKAVAEQVRRDLRMTLGTYRGTVGSFGHEGLPKYVDTLQRAREKYEDIMPSIVDHPVTQQWHIRQGDALTVWEKLRASCLASFRNGEVKLPFHVAGREMCELKSFEHAKRQREETGTSAGPHLIAEQQYVNYGPNKKRKIKEQVSDELELAIQDGFDDDLVDGYDHDSDDNANDNSDNDFDNDFDDSFEEAMMMKFGA